MKRTTILTALTAVLVFQITMIMVARQKHPTERKAQIVSGEDTITVVGNFYMKYTIEPHVHNDSLIIIQVPQIHCCNWEGCRQTGRTTFIPSYEPDTDGYYWELTHFEHPAWTNDQVEQYVFSSVKM